MPEEYRTNDRLMYRMLACEKFDHAKALKHMIEHSRWIRQMFPLRMSVIALALNAGFLYVSGRDYSYRPIMILNVAKLVEHDPSSEVLQATTAFFCDWVVKKLLIPGRVENWIMIIDLHNIGVASLPVKKVKGVVDLTQTHFGGRLFRQLCINMSFMLRKSSSVFLNFVDDIT